MPSEFADTVLSRHYADCGHAEYFDDDGKGKPERFVEVHKWNDVQIEALDDDDLFATLDPHFPIDN